VVYIVFQIHDHCEKVDKLVCTKLVIYHIFSDGHDTKKVYRYDTDTTNFDETIYDTILYRVVKVFRHR
jgi:hypothetical protein